MRVTRNCISALGLILALAAAQPVRAAELLDALSVDGGAALEVAPSS